MAGLSREGALRDKSPDKDALEVKESVTWILQRSGKERPDFPIRELMTALDKDRR